MPSKSVEVECHLDLFRKIRRAAANKSDCIDEKTIRRHAAKHPPSLYKAGETVLIQFQSKKWNKGKGVSVPKATTATITKVNHKLNKYKVKAVIDINGQKAEEWLQVANISSLTRDEENKREKNVSGMKSV